MKKWIWNITLLTAFVLFVAFADAAPKIAQPQIFKQEVANQLKADLQEKFSQGTFVTKKNQDKLIKDISALVAKYYTNYSVTGWECTPGILHVDIWVDFDDGKSLQYVAHFKYSDIH